MGCYKAGLVRFTQNYTETWNSKKAIITNPSPQAAISTFHPTQPQSQPYPYVPPFPKSSPFNTVKWPPVKNNFFFFLKVDWKFPET